MSYFDDVGDFHRKFGLPTYRVAKPALLEPATLRFRLNFLMEELAEYCEACGVHVVASSLRIQAKLVQTVEEDILVIPGGQDLHKAADALADLTYVALGTAHLMGLPFDTVWDTVQRANMTKERATGADDPRSKRGSALDVVKPEGWIAPNHNDAIKLALAMWRGSQPKDQE